MSSSCSWLTYEKWVRARLKTSLHCDRILRLNNVFSLCRPAINTLVTFNTVDMIPSVLNAENVGARVSVTQSSPHVLQEYNLQVLHELEICHNVLPDHSPAKDLSVGFHWIRSIISRCLLILTESIHSAEAFLLTRAKNAKAINSRYPLMVKPQRRNRKSTLKNRASLIPPAFTLSTLCINIPIMQFKKKLRQLR